jgi:hypothetical protein
LPAIDGEENLVAPAPQVARQAVPALLIVLDQE